MKMVLLLGMVLVVLGVVGVGRGLMSKQGLIDDSRNWMKIKRVLER